MGIRPKKEHKYKIRCVYCKYEWYTIELPIKCPKCKGTFGIPRKCANLLAPGYCGSNAFNIIGVYK